MATPPDTQPIALAAHHWRLLALLIDYLFWLGVIKLAQQWLLPPAWDVVLIKNPDPQNFSWLLLLWLLLSLRDLPRGCGLGKCLTGLAVVSATHPQQPPSLKQLILRNLTLPLLPLEAWFVFRHRYGLRWGDRLARSVVVTPAKTFKPLTRLWGLLSLLFAFSLAAFSVNGRTLQHSQAFQTAIKFATTHPATAKWKKPIAFSKRGQLNLKIHPKPSACLVLWGKTPKKKAKLEVILQWQTKTKLENIGPKQTQPQHWQPKELHLLNGNKKPCPHPNTSSNPPSR